MGAHRVCIAKVRVRFSYGPPDLDLQLRGSRTALHWAHNPENLVQLQAALPKFMEGCLRG